MAEQQIIAFGMLPNASTFSGQFGSFDVFPNISGTNTSGPHSTPAPAPGAMMHLQASNQSTWDFMRMSVMINASFLIIQLIIFSMLLCQERTSRLVASRYPLVGQWKPPIFFVGWIKEAWRNRAALYSQDVDASMMLRFCILGFKFSAIGTFFSFFLVPLYANYMRNAIQKNVVHLIHLDSMNVFTLSNADGNEALWVAIFVAYLLVGFFFHFCAIEWQEFVSLRRLRVQRIALGLSNTGWLPGAAQAQRSILVENVPASAQSPDGSQVHAFFARFFSSRGIHSCVLMPDRQLLGHSDSLRRATTSRSPTPASKTSSSSRSRMESPTASEAPPMDEEAAPIDEAQNETQDSSGSAGKTSGEGGGPACGAKEASTRSIDTGRSRMYKGVISRPALQCGRRARQIARLAKDLTIGSSQSRTAFVTFTSLSDRVVAEQVVLAHPTKWQTSAAPEVRDIVWANAAVRTREAQAREFLGIVAVGVGLGFWSVVVGFVQAVAVLAARNLQGLKLSCPSMYTFLLKYVPVLMLMLLQWMLPYVLWFGVIGYEKCKTKSVASRRVLWRNLAFQFATLYVTVISQSLSDSFKNQLSRVMEQSMTEVLGKLSDEVPSVAWYFVSYVMARTGITLPMLLLFPVLSGGGPVAPDFAYEAASLGMVLVLGLTYSVICPIIMPVCMLYFAFAYFVYCWLFRYAYSPDFDCAGAFWRELYCGAVIGLLFGTLSLAALVGGRTSWTSSPFVALLLLAVVVLLLHSILYKRWTHPSQFISLEEAGDADGLCTVPPLQADYYLHPAIRSGERRSRADGPAKVREEV